MIEPSLTPSRLQLLRSHFEAALEAAPADLDAWLATAIPSDLPLRTEVRSLLTAHADDSATLASPFSLEPPFDTGSADRTGQRVGAWSVVRQIGGGGMGTVYEAHRAEGDFKQRVAMKFLRRSVEGEHAVRQFREERQILASLHHPNIAALLDGGVAPGGQPYFALEFVDGQPITTWCNGRRLDVRGRLVLFLQVCAAVQHAHQSLVVHRDLKPGNILVDATGTVKLLDFGIAKLLGQADEAEHLPAAQGAGRMFTPDYASPEQVLSLPVGTASDVYALGVVLFELLTGRRPFVLRGRLLSEIEQTICHEPPPRPGNVVTADHWQQLHAGSPARAREQLSGDLDAIVLAALRKEPDRRYGSAEQLARDLRAFLDGLPVTARQGGAGYRFGKFVRRRRIELTASTLAVAALVGGVITSRANARDAERERSRAMEITTFLTDMLVAPDPSALGREVTMREVVDSAAVRADSLRDRPALEREIRHVIGGTYVALGQYPQAIVEFEKALAAARRESPRSRTVALSLARLAGAHEHAGDYPVADSLLGEALAMLDRLGLGETLETFEWLDQRGQLLARLGKFRESEPLLRRAVHLLAAAQPGNDSATGAAWHNLAMVTSEIGQNDSADAYFRTALQLERGVLGDDHPLVLATRVAHATVLERLGRIDQAMTIFEQVIEARRRVLGPDHPDYAWSLFNYADFLLLVGRNAEAAAAAREVLALRGRSLPETHMAVSTSMQVLGRALSRLDSLDAAEHWLRESLALRRAALPADHWILASSQSALAEHLTHAGRFGEAESLLVNAEQELVRLRGEEAQPVRDTRMRLVALYAAWNKPAEREHWQQRAGEVKP